MHPRALIRRVETYCRLPRAVVEVRVPRGPGAVEGKGQLLVVLVLLTPHPKSLEHLVCIPQNRTDVRPAWQATISRCAHPSAGGARQQESTSTWAAANLHPGCDSRPRGAAGRRAAASSTSALAPVLRRPALVALNARAVAPPPTVQGQPTLRIHSQGLRPRKPGRAHSARRAQQFRRYIVHA